MEEKFPLVIGLGATGSSLIDYLSKSYEKIFLIEDWKDNPNLKRIIQEIPKVVINPKLDNELFSQVSKIYPSPGVPSDHVIFGHARKNKLEVSSDIQEFLVTHKSTKILVTGTNGKTSTCLLIKHLFEFFYPNLKIAALGNIGEPVLDYLGKEVDVSIIEVSSFQLELLNQIEFEIGLLLNIEQDHLDRHGTFKEYKAIKEKVLKHSAFNISFNNRNSLDKDYKNYHNHELPKGFLESSTLLDWPLHDKQNLRASIEVLNTYSKHYKGIKNNKNLYEGILKSLKSFRKLPHRFEFIKQCEGVSYINDSKATNIDAMIKAVNSANQYSQEGNIYLICGGDLKGQDILSADLSELSNVRKILIYGKDKATIFNSMNKHSESLSVLDLESAFRITVSMAKEGDYVLLSPACSSLDMFSDYRERGDRFKQLVNDL